MMAAAVEADKAEAQVEAAVEVEAEVPVEFPSGGGAFGAAPAAASAASASAAASPVFGSAPVSQGEVKAAAEEQAAPTAPSLVPFDAARAALTSCATPAGAAPANRGWHRRAAVSLVFCMGNALPHFSPGGRSRNQQVS